MTTDEFLLMQRIVDALELIAERLKPEATMREETPEESDQREGWIKWEGGDNPPIFPTSADRVEIRFRDNDERPASIAEANTMMWEHMQAAGDIVAWRLVT